MARALQHHLDAGAHRVVLAGSDAPTLPSPLLIDALAALVQSDVSFVPAADGGYVAVAARRAAPSMFEGARMSSEHTLAESLAACERVGLSASVVGPWYDVDVPRDLARLIEGAEPIHQLIA